MIDVMLRQSADLRPYIHPQAAEDKANHLNRVKYKLEQNLDELEDSVEREKKVSE